MRISPNVATLPGDDPARRLEELAAVADDRGADTLWIPDHLQQSVPGRDRDEPLFEAYQALTWLAARTRRVRLGALVTSVAFRPPALLIKQVNGLDVLSGGRAWLGIGAGYPSAENEALGIGMPPTAERFETLEDTLRLAHHVWSGDRSAFEGATLRMPDPVLPPLPVARPHPPILVGGMGERKTLRLVARYADAANLFDIGDDAVLRHKLEVLRRHLDDAGRDPAAVELTIGVRWDGDSLDGTLSRIRDLERLGFTHAVVLRGVDWTPEDLTRILVAG